LSTIQQLKGLSPVHVRSRAMLGAIPAGIIILAGCGELAAPSLTPSAAVSPVPTATSSPSPYPSPSPTPTPSPSPTPTEIVFTIVKYLSPIKAGHRTQLTIKVPPGASCFLSYTTPSGTVSATQGLGPRTATSDGICGWTWSIRSNTRPGTGMLEITVNGVTVTMPIEIEPQ
jgi:hypothetical protein